MASSAWWYAQNGERLGPHPAEHLQVLYRSGALSDNTLVWTKGMASWAKVSTVPELSSPKPFLPPPLPEAPRPFVPPAIPASPYEPPKSDPRAASLGDPDLRSLHDPIAGPWRRFFARSIDLQVIGFPLGLAIGLFLLAASPSISEWVSSPGSEYIVGFALLPIILLMEAIIVAVFRNSPGKAALGIKVRTLSGQRLTLHQYVDRQMRVYVTGYGIGFPIVTLFTMGSCYSALKNEGSTTYDRGQFRVTAAPMSAFRWLSVLVLIVALLLFNGLITALGTRNVNVAVPSPTASVTLTPQVTWRNPDTQRTVKLPSGWVHEPLTNADNQPYHAFGPSGDVTTTLYAIYASEQTALSGNVDAYADAFIAAVQSDMTLVKRPDLNAAPGVLVLTGSTATAPYLDLHISLVPSGNHVSRVIVAGLDAALASPEYATIVAGQQLMGVRTDLVASASN
jgi:uncharacterized RDD family membrane protein YckC